MSFSKSKQSRASRKASVIICVLVVIMLVGMLSMQTIQTVALIRRGDEDRAKIIQTKELDEFAKSIDWGTTDSQTISIQIPSSVSSIGEPETQAAILERQTIEDNQKAARIVVRFPADKPGEVTTTVEPDHE